MPTYRDLTSNENNLKKTPFEGDALMGGQSEYVEPNPSKAGAGRGKQGGPTAAQARQNRGMMSDAEKAARDEAMEMKEQKAIEKAYQDSRTTTMKAGGKVSSASKRADGIAQRGKTKGTMVAMCGGGYMKGKK